MMERGSVADILEIPWGWQALDQAVGPLVRGRVYVVGARPGCGKTALSLSWIAAHLDRVLLMLHAPAGGAGSFAAYPRRILACLTERSPIAARAGMAAAALGLEHDLVIRQRWDLLPAWAEARVADRLEWYQQAEHHGVVRWVDLARPTTEALAKEVEDFRPHIVWLDYLQRLRPSGREDRFAAVGEAVHYLQRLAQQVPLIAVVMSQLKRRGDGVFDKYRPPYLEDFKLSGEIEELADVALGLFRPLRRLTNEEERAVRNGERGLEDFTTPGMMAVKVVKHRYWGEAADRLIQLRVTNGLVTDWHMMPAPAAAGDAWEDNERAPF
jgi:DnaB-like helicase C terminal domain